MKHVSHRSIDGGNDARILLLCLSLVVCSAVSCGSRETSWTDSIRTDHPRLFFNAETWPAVKARALGEEREWYDDLVRRVDGYPDNPTTESTRDDFAYRKKADGTYETVRAPRPTEWGFEAAYTAFVYRVTGEARYLDKAKKMLQASAEAYHECFRKGMTVNWYSRSRVHWLAAYDWLYNDLTDGERAELMGSFLSHLDKLQPRPERPDIYRLNDSDHTTGFYGDRNLLWFAGLAAYGDGIDDDLAMDFLRKGYEYNTKLFEYRTWCAGDDGGLASASPNYAMGAYPWAQYNFLYTWRSATGEDVASDWPHLAYFPVWVMWNFLPGPTPREFGTGDTYHYDNTIRTNYLYTHMSQIMDFYGDSHPECAALADYIRSILPERHRRHNMSYGFYPFLLTNMKDIGPPDRPLDAALHARHFETLGQVFMRSGTGPDDTYSLFTIGSRVPSHKQHDENNFVIFKKGYLALDSGTRGRETGYQLRHYYSQTVAHNCMLINMPDEPFPDYWGMAYDGPEGEISCGGTFETIGGACAAFETNDHYTYTAGDATACYSPEKCELALRQYVFVYPDYFIICDRVTATDADHGKAWLLHTQNEPAVSGATFRANHEDGRLFSRTIFPKDAVLTKIGGPGKEFLACGKNWELAPEVAEMMKERYNGGLLGAWRIEVSPGSPRKEDVFLHLLHVGDRSLESMCVSEPIEGDGEVGVRFKAGNTMVEVRFATNGPPAGHIMQRADGAVLLDRDLTNVVQPQSGQTGQ